MTWQEVSKQEAQREDVEDWESVVILVATAVESALFVNIFGTFFFGEKVSGNWRGKKNFPTILLYFSPLSSFTSYPYFIISLFLSLFLSLYTYIYIYLSLPFVVYFFFSLFSLLSLFLYLSPFFLSLSGRHKSPKITKNTKSPKSREISEIPENPIKRKISEIPENPLKNRGGNKRFSKNPKRCTNRIATIPGTQYAKWNCPSRGRGRIEGVGHIKILPQGASR